MNTSYSIMASRKPNAAALLAARMVERLAAQRPTQPDHPFPLLADLIAQEEQPAESETLGKAIRHKDFKNQAIGGDLQDLQSPVAFKDDLAVFASSPQLLVFLQSKTPRGEGQPFLVKDLQKAIRGNAPSLNAELKKAFEAALRPKIEACELPDVALKKPKPPKQPKPKKPSKAQQLAVLSQALLEALQAQRTSGGDAYPATLKQLAQRAATELSRDEKLVLEAAGKSPFKEQVVAAWSKDLEAPVAFQEDLERLFGAPQLLERALRMKKEKSKTSLAHKANDLAKLLVGGRGKEKEQAAFCSAVARRLTSDSMPPGIGAIRLGPKGEPHFFLLEDLQPPSLRAVLSGAAPVAPRESTPPVASQESAAHFEEFAKRFEESFSQLDRQRGGHNFVSLADLRRELNTVPRAQFDAHLRRLRQERRFELSGAQSKQGLPEELREAGVIEAGNLLMYVSRRK